MATQRELTALETTWPLVVACRPDSYWLKAERSGELPTIALAEVAACYRDAERWQPPRKLVEARLAVPECCHDAALA